MGSSSLTHKPWPTLCCPRIPGICALTRLLSDYTETLHSVRSAGHMDRMQSPLLLSFHWQHQPSMTPNKLIIPVIPSISIGSLQNKKINLTKSYVSLWWEQPGNSVSITSEGMAVFLDHWASLQVLESPWCCFSTFWPTCVLLREYIVFVKFNWHIIINIVVQCTILYSSSEYQLDKGPWEVYKDKEQGNSPSSEAR